MSETLIEQLIRHEGMKLFPYADRGGKVTIGVGRNLTDCGISRDEAMTMLTSDIADARADLVTLEWFAQLNDVRKQALTNMRFNLGPTRFRGFVLMLAALALGRFSQAAGEMRASEWYHQVGARGEELAWMVATGEAWPGR